MYLGESQPIAESKENLDSQLTQDDKDELRFLFEQWWIRQVEGKMSVPGWIAHCRKDLLGEITGMLNGYVVRMCGGSKS
jgi:hypothetical protein